MRAGVTAAPLDEETLMDRFMPHNMSIWSHCGCSLVVFLGYLCLDLVLLNANLGESLRVLSALRSESVQGGPVLFLP